ncbi:unnamed protein product, partial [Gongylonema pulchrum]|uniref:PI3K/PI4K domain-containing protein n=1 Tax=Gongylonema pulchrum TaxID=637853 RepID=A0A183D6M9_9BILA
MAMLGSILGLGDRHLDNILVNFETGHIVHIDYNVCFDKGRSLRVPEMVPFRLTGNIVQALGPTGIEGTFRLSCEHVLTKLRAGKELLRTILDAFVYDPLVDWAAAQDDLSSKSTIAVATMIAVYGADKRAEFVHSMARSLFILRIKEIATAWLANKDRLHYALLEVAEALEAKCKNVRAETRTAWIVEKRKLNAERIITACRELKSAITQHNGIMHDIRP